MMEILFLILGLFIGAAFPITLNRIRRRILAGKFFGPIEAGKPDPTSQYGAPRP